MAVLLDLMLPYTVNLSQYRLLENTDLIAQIDHVGAAIYTQTKGGAVHAATQ